MTAAIDKVAHEQVVCIRAFTTNLKELLEVIELAVNVSTDLTVNQKFFLTYRYRALDVLHVALLLKNLFGTIAECFHFGLLNGFTALELFDPLVEIVH